MGITDFFTNEGKEQVVEAPAFSLTKVLTSGAMIITPVAALLTKWLGDATPSEWNYVALTLGLLGFLAIAGAADVIARAIATAAESKAKAKTAAAESHAKATESQAKGAESQAKAAAASVAQLVTFTTPLDGRHVLEGTDKAVKVFAVAQGVEPYYLVQEDSKINWLTGSEVSVP